MASEHDADFKKFVNRVREDLVPKIEGSTIFVSITPTDPAQVDVKFAVELGLAIMYNKPIIAVIKPGTKVPEKLTKVVDKFVELDLTDPTQQQRLTEAIHEMLENKGE